MENIENNETNSHVSVNTENKDGFEFGKKDAIEKAEEEKRAKERVKNEKKEKEKRRKENIAKFGNAAERGIPEWITQELTTAKNNDIRLAVIDYYAIHRFDVQSRKNREINDDFIQLDYYLFYGLYRKKRHKYKTLRCRYFVDSGNLKVEYVETPDYQQVKQERRWKRERAKSSRDY